jgi:hypothetical protein
MTAVAPGGEPREPVPTLSALVRDDRPCDARVVDENPLADKAFAAGLVQPDPTTCGSSVLVVSRMLNDASYAAFLVDGTDPATGQEGPGTVQSRFAEQTLAMHRLTSGARDSGGGLQLPWPSALGTRPWAVAREMTHQAGRKGVRYAARPVLPTGSARTAAFDRLASLAAEGLATPLYVGNAWSPRHVVLVLSTEAGRDEVLIYDPARGRRYPITRDDFVGARLDVAGWSTPWVVVTPA